ncbi:MAG: hypothetical protein N2C12_03950 [Planctomycetales bacterium]
MKSGRDSRGVRVIMLAVFVWTVVLSLGVAASSRSWLGGAIVLACGTTFLAVWKLALVLRRE